MAARAAPGLRGGSVLDPTAYEALLDGQEAAMVFTDPPYNVPIDGHAMGKGSIRHRELDAGQFTEFLRSACSLLAQNSRDGAIHFVCMDWRHMGDMLAAGSAVYSELKRTCAVG